MNTPKVSKMKMMTAASPGKTLGLSEMILMILTRMNRPMRSSELAEYTCVSSRSVAMACQRLWAQDKIDAVPGKPYLWKLPE